MGIYDFLLIAFSLLAVFGLYSLICRLVLLLLPKGIYRLAVSDEQGKNGEELATLTRAARFYTERCAAVKDGAVVLLERPDPEKEDTLRKEGILVYIRRE